MSLDMISATQSGHASIDRWNGLLNAVAPQLGVPPNLAKAHMLYESGGDPNIVGSSGRGLGLMQIDYGTTLAPDGGWYYEGPAGRCNTPFDPHDNILIGCRDFIAPLIAAFPDNLDAIVAGYNAGEPAVTKALADGVDLTTVTFAPWYIPSVTAAYTWLCAEARKGTT